MERFTIALVGAGMFGSDVHLRAYAGLQRSGLSPYLGRLGLDAHARALSGVEFQLVAIATRSPESAERSAATFREWTGQKPATYCGNEPWKQLLHDFAGV